MITRPKFRLSMFLAVLLVGLPASAYDDPLTSTSIRDAYMLGKRKDFKTDEFFARYKHFLPAPETGPHVAAISVETPYGQVVELGEAALNTDIQGVEEKWAGKLFPFIVRVGVDLTETNRGRLRGIHAHQAYRCQISNVILKFSLFKTTRRFPPGRLKSICFIPMRSRTHTRFQEPSLNCGTTPSQSIPMTKRPSQFTLQTISM